MTSSATWVTYLAVDVHQSPTFSTYQQLAQMFVLISVQFVKLTFALY